MAEQVGNQLELDEVWFMPTAKPPHAPGKTTIASQHRVQMIQLAIENNPLFKVQPYEIHRGGVNYTVDTMRHFVETYPESDFYFIIINIIHNTNIDIFTQTFNTERKRKRKAHIRVWIKALGIPKINPCS